MATTRFPARAAGVAERMAGFIAHLRLNGVKLGPAETREALAALSVVRSTDPGVARLALRAALVPDAEGWRRFDELFDAYWHNAGRQRGAAGKGRADARSARPVLWRPHLEEGPEGGDGGDEDTPDPGGSDGEAEGIDGRLIATRTENLHRRDLRELMDEASLREAERAAERIAHAIRDRRSRRLRAARRGQRLDLRRVLRGSLARGGEPLELFRKIRPERPMNIVALCDVSGSMTVYSRVFLAFVRGLVNTETTADAYLFHTRLMRVTGALRDHDRLRSAGRLSLMAEGFGGGTDIGASLTQFVKSHGARALGRRTMVLILSDGYCTGTPDALGGAVQRIARRARRVVWLNPLLGWRDYAPVAAGIAAALPHVDAHLPANTLDALAALEDDFAKL